MRLKPLEEAIEDLKQLYKTVEEGGDACTIDCDDRGYYCMICGIIFDDSNEKENKNVRNDQYSNS